jgi:DNA-binding FadR family transcriptional regulator
MAKRRTSVNGAPASLGLAPLRSPHLYEQIVARLKAEIAQGRLLPGARLPSERDLAQALEVSRPSVREAVAALQNAEILETRRGAGSFVSERAPELVLHENAAAMVDASPRALLEVREILEPEIAAKAAEHAAGKPVEDPVIERLLDEMDTIVDFGEPGERRRWSDADRAFHRQLASMTGNPIIEEFAEQIQRVMDQLLWQRLRDEATSKPHRLRIYAAEHRLIYEAVIGGAADKSRRYALEHVRRVRTDMALD